MTLLALCGILSLPGNAQRTRLDVLTDGRITLGGPRLAGTSPVTPKTPYGLTLRGFNGLYWDSPAGNKFIVSLKEEEIHIGTQASSIAFYDSTASGTKRYINLQAGGYYEEENRYFAPNGTSNPASSWNNVMQLTPLTTAPNTNSKASKGSAWIDSRELGRVVPECIVSGETDNARYVSPSALIPQLTEAVLQLTRQLDKQETQLNRLLQPGSPSTQQTAQNEEKPTLNLPETAKAATLKLKIDKSRESDHYTVLISDMEGNIIHYLDRTGKTASLLPQERPDKGMYLFSLFANGELMETQRVLLE